MTNIIPFEKAHSDLKCSFCGALKSKSKHFWTNGKGQCVCDKCIKKAKSRLEEEDKKDEDLFR